MNLNAVAKQYGRLTPEERFRLILAASGRGDEAEKDRLATAAERITLSMQDHSHFAQAYNELALMIFVGLLEDAARYNNAVVRAGHAADILGDDEDDEAVDDPDLTADAEPAETTFDRSVLGRDWDVALVTGFVLRTKADGWRLFCERLSVPPLLLWEGFPGLDRLQRLLTMAERLAFVDKGFLRWLNRVRPPGEAERTESPFTVKGTADATDKAFRDRANWWGG